MVPLEVRFHHNPESPHGFVGAALSSVLWHFHKDRDAWKAEPVVEVPAEGVKGWDIPVPGLISDLVVSLDDRWLYFSNWLHGDVRQYDISDPSKPKLTGQVWVGGVLGKGPKFRERDLRGGPQMLQLAWTAGGSTSPTRCSPVGTTSSTRTCARGCFRSTAHPNGGLALDSGSSSTSTTPDGPARAHEVRLQGGDCTTEIFQ